MSDAPALRTQSQPPPSLGTRRRWARLVVAAVLLGLAGVGLAISWYRLLLLPRDQRRELTEGFLQAVMVGHAVAVGIVPLGVLVLAAYLVRERRRRRRHPRAARLLLLGCSGLCALGLLEAASALWETWHDRLPSLPTRFRTAALPGTVHIVVIGGSSALGEPYRPWLSVGQVLAWRLGQALPHRRFDLTIVARLGASLRDMHFELARLERKPDLLVIYAGHNEFVARYEEQRDVSWSVQPRAGWRERLYQVSLSSPFYRLVAYTVSRNRLDGPPPPVSRHQLIDPPQVTPAEYAAVLADFRRRFEAIVSWCERIACLPLLIIPPSNERDLEPSRSVLPPEVGPDERRRVAVAFDAARRDETADAEAARRAYESILERYPHFAEARYRLGRLLERQRQPDAAQTALIAARDDDALITRCNSEFQHVYREVQERHPACVLVDGPAVLRSRSPDRLLGDELIQDMHHPNLAGTVLLAEAALAALHARKAFGWTGPLPSPITPADAAEQFGMDAEKWVVVCDRTRIHYERIAQYRYDPSARLLRAALYGQAARRIAEGTPPDEAGVVGLGVRLPDPGPRRRSGVGGG